MMAISNIPPSLFNGSANFRFKLTDSDGAEVTDLTFEDASINANPC